MNGPVPSAALLRSPYFLTPASLMMKPQKPPRAASSPANGSLVTNLTAYLPAGSTLSTAMKYDLPGDFSNRRSNVNFTSVEVIAFPSWIFTPWRSLNVHVSSSLLTSHDSARSGAGFMSASKRTSWLYIMGERRLREKAGTSCGSSPVASLFCAETSVPPLLGVCAKAGRPRPRAPTARPPARRRSRRLRREAGRGSGSVRMVVSPVAAGLCGIGVEDVAKAVAHQVEREHGDHDRDAREHRDPRGGLEMRAPLVEHVAPRRDGRLGRQAEVAQRGFDEDGLGQGDGALHHEGRDHVGQHVLEGGGHAGGPEGADRLDVFLLALGEHRAAHDPREDRRVDDGDGDHRAVDPGPAHRRD